MRLLLSAVIALALCSTLILAASEADARASGGSRGGSGFHAGAGRSHVGHRGFRHHMSHRSRWAARDRRFHGNRRNLGGGVWPYAGAYGYGGLPDLNVETNVQVPAYAIPASTGIRSAPAGTPVVYVIQSPRLSRGKVRKGHGLGPGAKILSTGSASSRGAAEAADARHPAPADLGPRIIHVNVPRGR